MKVKQGFQKLLCVLLTLVVCGVMTISVCAAPITLRIMTVWGGTQKEELDKLFAEYSKVRPNVKIVHEVCAGTGAGTYQEVLQTALASGSGPDIYFEWGGELAGFFIDSGFAEPLAPFYKKYSWDKILIPWAVKALNRNGKVYGVPISTHGMTFWYRVDLMNKLGLKEPNTYSELEALCKKAKGAGLYPLSLGGKYDWMTMRLLDYLIEYSCGPKLHDELNALKASWDRPEVVRAFQLFKKWVDNGWITPGFLAVNPDDARMPMYQGSALMVFEGSWLESTIIGDGQNPRNFDFFLNPTGHKPLRISGFPEQFMISAISKHKDEAAEFINWVIQPGIQQKSLGKAFASTGTKGVFPDKEKLPRTYKWRQVLPDLDDVYPPTDQAFKSELLHEFFQVQDALVTGDITPEQGAKQFQKAVEAWKAKNKK